MSCDVDDSNERGTRWEGYSDYQTVSKNIAEAVDQAINSYAEIKAAHTHNVKINAETAAKVQSHILSAAIRLLPELEKDRETVEEYDEVLERWLGDSNEDTGWIEELESTPLDKTEPEWLGEMVKDLRRAAWQLGYLQAGQEKDVGGDPDERQVESMFSNA